MITIKDLAPLDDMQLESWRNALKNFDKETMKDLYIFCQDFFVWPCRKHHLGETCDSCADHDFCLRCKLTIAEVKHELIKRSFLK
jgi:hypothetical protein|nr:MAG TPA_asm: hypothetical protein [Caudoviricetes sp.]